MKIIFSPKFYRFQYKNSQGSGKIPPGPWPSEKFTYSGKVREKRKKEGEKEKKDKKKEKKGRKSNILANKFNNFNIRCLKII